MSTDLFSVHVFFDDGTNDCVLSNVPPREAMDEFNRQIKGFLVKIGKVRRIIITDSSDATNADWQIDKGLVFPTEEDLVKYKNQARD